MKRLTDEQLADCLARRTPAQLRSLANSLHRMADVKRDRRAPHALRIARTILGRGQQNDFTPEVIKAINSVKDDIVRRLDSLQSD